MLARGTSRALSCAITMTFLLSGCNGSPASGGDGPETDADLAACVADGPILTPRADCPNDRPTEDDCPTASPFYAEVAPIFATRCAICHGASGLETKYQFDTYAEVHDVVAVRSLILFQIYNCRMPPSCAPNLSPDERRTMLKWFVCGAPESADAGAD